VTVLSHIIRYVSAFALALLLVGPLQAQRATSHIPVDSVYAGDRFGLIVELGHEGLGNSLFPHELIPDSLIAGNRMRLPIGDFLLLSVRSRGERQVSNGVRLDSVVYEATTFAIDTARVDAIPVGLVNGIDTTLVLADGAVLRVASLLGEANPERRDSTDLALFARSWTPGRRQGIVEYDLPMRGTAATYLSSSPVGTGHGSPYWYDRWVPLVFLGAGVQPGRSEEAVHTVDLAPTLAFLAGIAVPEGLDGRVLEVGADGLPGTGRQDSPEP